MTELAHKINGLGQIFEDLELLREGIASTELGDDKQKVVDMIYGIQCVYDLRLTSLEDWFENSKFASKVEELRSEFTPDDAKEAEPEPSLPQDVESNLLHAITTAEKNAAIENKLIRFNTLEKELEESKRITKYHIGQNESLSNHMRGVNKELMDRVNLAEKITKKCKKTIAEQEKELEFVHYKSQAQLEEIEKLKETAIRVGGLIDDQDRIVSKTGNENKVLTADLMNASNAVKRLNSENIALTVELNNYKGNVLGYSKDNN
jgi:uncharacterized protein YdaU (DUF1376 family)